MEFNVFKVAVAKQFERMKKHQLFRTGVDKDVLWATYLNSFPEGTNPIYRERTEHDCTCCKQFIRAVGDVVAVINGKVESIWDVVMPEEPGYQVVADALSAKVKSQSISDIFLHYEPTAGTNKSLQQMVDRVITWDHFFINVPKELVRRGGDIASALAEPRESKNVLHRGLTELTMDAIDTVLELIGQRSLYRGEEHQESVKKFKRLKVEFDKLTTDAEKHIFSWTHCLIPGSVARFRNTVIGSLLVDLSAGVDLEDAVKMFESKVAPTNYKRPKALVTPSMVAKAKAELENLGLTSALDRRYAVLADVTVDNVIYANRDAKKTMNRDVFDEVAATSTKRTGKKTFDKVEEVGIETFLTKILPTAESIEVMFENAHAGNLVSLIAPNDPSAGKLFKWNNGFSWSYNGEVADSIKERVKRAGGSVSGDLCCRLAWFNHDDLDLHMVEPSGYEIYFGNRHTISPAGGRLDVDMNAGSGQTREPVENIFYNSRKTMKEGVYKLRVNNWARRETTDVGFEVEIDMNGEVLHFAHPNAVANSATVTVAEIEYTKENGFRLVNSLPHSQTKRQVWGLTTQEFHQVNVVMLSPNYWDEHGVGNKHYFFMLDGAANDGLARGFYNEFLSEELSAHRKVLEMVGSKLALAPAAAQLSGLGFSSTQPASLLCRVKGKFTRVVKIVF